MKAYTRKLAVLIAALTMVVSMAAGCGGTVNPPASSQANGQTTAGTAAGGTEASGDETQDTAAPGDESTAAGETDGSGATNAVTNADGKTTAKPAGSSTTKGNSGTFQEPIYDLKGRVIVVGGEGVPDMSKKTIYNESVKLTEAKYNCTFKFVKKEYVSLYQDLINGHAAGKSNYDVVNLRGYEIFPNAANSGAVLAASDYYDFANDPTWQDSAIKNLGVIKGKRYGIPYSPNEVGSGIWYNRALLRKFNVPDLWTYVEKDTWNWQTFRAVCKKLTQDTNGDGKPDFWGFTSSDPWLEFVYSNNGALISSGVSGTPRIALDSKNALDAIQFVADLHMVDNTVPDGRELGAITDKPFNALFTGKVAMYPYHARYGAVMLNMGIPAADIGWVYMPKGPAAKNYVTASGTMPDMFVVPLDINSPKEVVTVIQDMAAYWDTSRKVRVNMYGKTQELYEILKTSLDTNAKKVLDYQAKNAVYTLANNYNLSQTLQNELWPAILNGKSVKSAVDSVKSKMQSELTTKYNGTIVK